MRQLKQKKKAALFARLSWLSSGSLEPMMVFSHIKSVPSVGSDGAGNCRKLLRLSDLRSFWSLSRAWTRRFLLPVLKVDRCREPPDDDRPRCCHEQIKVRHCTPPFVFVTALRFRAMQAVCQGAARIEGQSSFPEGIENKGSRFSGRRDRLASSTIH